MALRGRKRRPCFGHLSALRRLPRQRQSHSYSTYDQQGELCLLGYPMTQQPSQVDKFKDLARELETDGSEERFDERLRKIVKSPLTEADQKQKPDGHPAKNECGRT